MVGAGNVRVVGVALLLPGPAARVLAARRTAPAALAGGWELPGGKCRAGESLEDAAVRELDEELGCAVRVTGRLAGRADLGEGRTLEVVTAVLDRGEPWPLEHDALRWLTAGELDTVAWLPADLVFLDELRRLLAAPGTVVP